MLEIPNNMLDTAEKKYLDDIKSTLIKWVISLIGTLIIGLIVFYFKVEYGMERHDEKIDLIELRVSGVENKIERISIDPALNTKQIDAIKDMVEDIRERQVRAEERQDKMYDIMIDIANKQK